MMPRLRIDFARRQASPVPAGVVLLVAASVLLVLSGERLWQAYRHNDRARAAFETAHHDAVKTRPLAVSRTPEAKLAEKQGEAVLRELTVPWQELLAIVEDYPDKDVALIGIDQNPVQSQIRITAEAKDLDGMVAYLKYLQGSALLGQAVLSAHLIENNVPGRPVRFQVAATWRKP